VIDVTVLVADDHLDAIEDVAAALQEAGLRLRATLPASGVITGAAPVSMHSIVWRIPSVQGQRDPSSKTCQQPALFCHIS